MLASSRWASVQRPTRFRIRRARTGGQVLLWMQTEGCLELIGEEWDCPKAMIIVLESPKGDT